MSDLISREQAIDAVGNCEHGEELFMIESLPSIDAVQVVRCKGCKSDLHAKTQKVPFCWWCGARMEKDNADE